MDKISHIEHKDQVSTERLSHIEHDAQERRMRPERFREWHQERKDEEIVPVTSREFWRAERIMTMLKDKAYPVEVYDCLHLVSSWVEAHPSLFKDSTSDNQRKQLTDLYSQALSSYRTYENTLYSKFSDKNAIEFKGSAEAYMKYYFEIIDAKRIGVTDITDVSKYKPFGHMLFDGIERCGMTPEALMDMYKDDKETQVFIATSAYSDGKQVLYRYHNEGLRKLLQKNSADLEAANWSTNPDEFARQDMTQKTAPFKTKLKDITDDAYGYYGSKNRLHSLYTIDTLFDEIEER